MDTSTNNNAKAAIAAIEELLGELAAIVVKVESDRDHETADRRLDRWRSRTLVALTAVLGSHEADRFSDDNTIHTYSYVDLVGNVVKKAKRYEARLISLKEELETHPEFALSEAGTMRDALAESREPVDPSCVFLVHGHDEGNLAKLRDLLRDRWDLDPKVLRAEAWAGRTLIEKFEEEAKEAAFAIALITPDDLIQSDDEEYVQGRPNVIFELGWFYGRLGRDRVTILLKQGTRLHSDLDGVGRIEFYASIDEAAVDLERELRAAQVI